MRPLLASHISLIYTGKYIQIVRIVKWEQIDWKRKRMEMNAIKPNTYR